VLVTESDLPRVLAALDATAPAAGSAEPELPPQPGPAEVPASEAGDDLPE